MGWQYDTNMTFDMLYNLAFRENPGQMRKSAQGWRDLVAMLDTLQGNVRNYREQMARDWDSEAGRKFVEKIDEVLGSVAGARTTASANGHVLDRTAENAEAAFKKLNEIKKRWDADVSRWNDRANKGDEDSVLGDIGDFFSDVGGDMFGDDEDLEKYRVEAVTALNNLDGDYKASDSAYNTSTGVPEYKGPLVGLPVVLPPGVGPGGPRTPPGISSRKIATPDKKLQPKTPPLVGDRPVPPQQPGKIVGPKLTGRTVAPVIPDGVKTPPKQPGVIRPPSINVPPPPVLPGGTGLPQRGLTPPGGSPPRTTAQPPRQPGLPSPGGNKPGAPPTGPQKGAPGGAPPPASRKPTKGGPKDPLSGDDSRRPGTPPSAGGGGNRKTGKPGQPETPHGAGPRKGVLGSPPSGNRGRTTGPADHDPHGLKPGTSGRGVPPSLSGRRPLRPGSSPDLEHDALGRRGSSSPVIGQQPKPGWGFSRTPEIEEDLTQRRPGAATRGASSPVLGGNPSKRRPTEQDDLLPQNRRIGLTDESMTEDLGEYAAPAVIDTPDEVRHGGDERGPVLGQGR